MANMDIVITDVGAASNSNINRIKLVLGDITDQSCDAIISLLPQSLELSGRINGSLLKKTGPALDDFILENIYQPKAGDVYALPAFGLPAKHIILAVRPNWKSDFDREDKHLVMCVRKTVVLAKCMLLKSIAFPPLAAGRKGYGEGRGARLLIQGILDRMDDRMEEVRIVCPDQTTFDEYKKRLQAKGWRG